MYKYPEKKKYVYVIPTIKGDCKLVFDQATASETNDYLEIVKLLLSDDTVKQLEGLTLRNKYIFNLIDKFFPYKWYEMRKRQLSLLVKREIDAYINDILALLHLTRKSMYSGTQNPKINGKVAKGYPFENHLEVISEKTHIPIDQLNDRLTMEQIGRYIDKIVYDAYETFKEGKAINNMLTLKKGLDESQKRDLEIIRKHFSNKKS